MKAQENIIQDICDQLARAEITEAQALSLIEAQMKTPTDEPAIEPRVYRQTFRYNEPYLRDHVIFDQQVLLGVTHCSIAIEAFKTAYPNLSLTGLQRFRFIEPIVVPPNETVEILVMISSTEGVYTFQMDYRLNASELSGSVASGEYVLNKSLPISSVALAAYQSTDAQRLIAEQFYQPVKAVVHLETLHTVQELFVSLQGTLAKLAISDTIRQTTPAYFLHPALLDGACVAVVSGNPILAKTAYVPFFIKAISLTQAAVPSQCYAVTEVTKITEDMVSCDIRFCDKNGQVLAHIEGLTFKKIDQKNFFQSSVGQHSMQIISSFSSIDTAHQKESVMTTTIPQPHAIEQYLKTKLSQLLAVEAGQLNIHLNFMELGLDSMQLMELAGDIEREIRIELYPTLFFEYANIKELTEYFAKEYQQPFHAYLEKTGAVLLQQPIATVIPISTPAPQPMVAQVEPSSTSSPVYQPAPSVKTTAADCLQDIAVIGMAGRFPNSDNLTQFSEHLFKGTDFVQEVPASRWDYHDFFDPNGQMNNNKIYCKWGSFIEQVAEFDAAFFNISEQEAKAMDPQIRLLLQTLYAASDDAGYSQQIRGSATGVYVGSSFQDYCHAMVDQQVPFSAYEVVGNGNTMAANRASYYLNLSGPSLMLDTSCSSSSVALHLACQALRNGDCETAFAAGVNLILSPRHYLMMCALGALSATGRCHTFDEAADGYLPSDAIAAVLLKPLTKAIADGDQIHAVIKGSAVNHGGHTTGVTAPNVTREAEVMLKAWKNANIDPRTLSYIEAHGTGTKLGDPIEIQAIKRAFAQHTADQQFCAIGSLKAHIGHAEAAAGVASLIKVILQMKAQRIVVMPHFKTLNSYINLDQAPIYINKTAEQWQSVLQQPRRAGINSFGVGGTYVHTVVEEFIVPEASKISVAIQSRQKLILLSAKTNFALCQYVTELKTYLLYQLSTLTQLEAEALLINTAYTLQIGREHLSQRVVLLVNSLEDLVTKLDQFLLQQANQEGVMMTHQRQEDINLMISGRAGQLYIEALLQEQDLSALAQLWILGVKIDWRLLYNAWRPAKVSLPTYPFAKERYWFDVPVKGLTISDVNHDIVKNYQRVMPEQLANMEGAVPDFLENQLLQAVTATETMMKSNRKLKKISKKNIYAWIMTELQKLTGLPDDQINADLLFEEFGINSIDMVTLYTRLGKFLGLPIPPGAFQDARTVNTLVDYVIIARHNIGREFSNMK